MTSTEMDNHNAEAKRQDLTTAETNFADAFERLMEHTDLRRCMDALGCVLEQWEERSEGSASARDWHERAQMLFDLGQQFQDMG